MVNNDMCMAERPEILVMVPAGIKKAMDVGCSSGEVSGALKREFGCEVIGIEIDKEKAEIASYKIDKVIVADAETAVLPYDAGYFDCIIFADVLEHLKSPLNALKKYLYYLNDNGALVISIPNVRHVSVIFELVFKGEWKYRRSGIMDGGHIRFFTINSFMRVLKEAGVRPVRIRRIFSLKGSKIFNLLTLGIFREFLTAQYIFLVKKYE